MILTLTYERLYIAHRTPYTLTEEWVSGWDLEDRALVTVPLPQLTVQAATQEVAAVV